MLLHKNKIINFLSIITLLFCFLYGISIYFHSITSISQDLGRHILLGEIIWNEHSIPDSNQFSYTYPDFPFLNHHWGGEVLLYLTHTAFGWDGLIILKLIFITVALGILSVYTIKRVNIIAFLSAISLILLILQERTEVRPELFGYVFFSLYLVIIYLAKEGKGRLLWYLPLIQVLWVNIHITFVFGPFLYGIFCIDRLLQRSISKYYALVGMTILTVLCINPYGLNGVIYPFTIFQNYGYTIVENMSPFFLESYFGKQMYFQYKGIALSIIGISILLIRRKYYQEILIVFFFLLMSAYAVRNMPFFGLALMYPLSLGLTILGSNKVFRQKLFINNNIRIQIIVLCSFLIYFIYNSLQLMTNTVYNNQLKPQRFGFGIIAGAKDAIDYFDDHNLSGPIFNSFDIGSYLIYRLYPRVPVFVDGRPEAYPKEFFHDVYIPIQSDPEQWEKALITFDFQTIVFPLTDTTPWAQSFIQHRVQDNRWDIVFLDDTMIIFVRVDPGSDEVSSKKQKFIRERMIELIRKTREPDELARLYNFVLLIGDTQLMDLMKVRFGK